MTGRTNTDQIAQPIGFDRRIEQAKRHFMVYIKLPTVLLFGDTAHATAKPIAFSGQTSLSFPVTAPVFRPPLKHQFKRLIGRCELPIASTFGTTILRPNTLFNIPARLCKLLAQRGEEGENGEPSAGGNRKKLCSFWEVGA